ncbi:MAG: class I SAM-dependent methyltransferase, partial [Anaerolineales bacterium]
MMEGINDHLDLSGVEQTALLTLYAKAMESKSEDPVLKDEKAEALVEKLDKLIAVQDDKMARQLKQRTVDPRLTIHLPLRTKKYDEYAEKFLEKHPEGVIVNIGCGLDTRFFRIDNGQLQFFDLDLPEMIALKQHLLKQNERYHMIGQSVLDFGWMDRVSALKRSTLILAEGVFMYLPEEKVKELVLELQRQFPEAELVCELTNRTWVEGFWGKLAAIKMKQRVKMSNGARFKFGVSDAEELESWGKGIEFLEKWFYMDDNHPKLGWIRMFRKWKVFNEAQYTAHYRLHAV